MRLFCETQTHNHVGHSPDKMSSWARATSTFKSQLSEFPASVSLRDFFFSSLSHRSLRSYFPSPGFTSHTPSKHSPLPSRVQNVYTIAVPLHFIFPHTINSYSLCNFTVAARVLIASWCLDSWSQQLGAPQKELSKHTLLHRWILKISKIQNQKGFSIFF